jgi:hypothetical protein
MDEEEQPGLGIKDVTGLAASPQNGSKLPGGWYLLVQHSGHLPARGTIGQAEAEMPICEADPWRLQYFEQAECPPGINIPTEDADAWEWYPNYRWVYDKIAIALSQGLEAGPHGTTPSRFPVFSKPITNLRGMGMGSRVIASAQDYAAAYTPGHMWLPLLDGPHVSSDVAVVGGDPRWWRHATGEPAAHGTFDRWTVQAEPDPTIEAHCGAWVTRNLGNYTGMLNLETIDGVIIEAHLRFSDQWPDLYGAGFVPALIDLYHRGVWGFADDDRRDGYSVVLFGPHGGHYRHPPRELVAELLARPGISSIQVTFHEDRPPDLHAMPPGGFRLAIVNSRDLAAGLTARERLRAEFMPASERPLGSFGSHDRVSCNEPVADAARSS